MADQTSTTRTDPDDVDVLAYADVLWRWRAAVAAVTVATIAVALITTSLAPPVYEATSVLMLTQSPYQVGTAPNPADPGPKIGSVLPQGVPAETLVVFAKFPSTLRAVAERAGRSGEGRPSVQMRAVPVRGTSLVELRVRGPNPREVATIANAWAAVLLSESQASFMTTARQSFTFFDRRLREAERSLRDAEEARRNFAASSPGGLLQTRVSALTNQISGYQSRLTDLTIASERASAELGQTEAQVAAQPKTLVLTKSLDSDPLLLQATRDAARRDVAQLTSLSLRTEELNPIYFSLVQARADLKIKIQGLETERAQVLAALGRLSGELDEARRQAASEHLTEARLAGTVASAKQVYDVLLQRRAESRVAAAVDTSPVRTVAEAVVPDAPVGPRWLLNLVLAGMLGFLVGSTSAFIAEALRAAKRRHRLRGDTEVSTMREASIGP